MSSRKVLRESFLFSLDLSNNEISDEGVSRLIEALKENETILAPRISAAF